MASTAVSLEDAKQRILVNGFCALDDPTVGERVSEMARRGFPCPSEYGLEFCEVNVLKDERIRPILEHFFHRSILGLYLKYAEDPGHIFCFRKGGERGFRVMIVQLWTKGSQVNYYDASHLQKLPAVRAANAMYETPLASLQRAGCEVQEKNFEDGGLSILDARVAFEIKHGSAITFAFTSEEVLEAEKWAKMLLPNLEGLKKRVAAMESATLGVNFAFRE